MHDNDVTNDGSNEDDDDTSEETALTSLTSGATIYDTAGNTIGTVAN